MQYGFVLDQGACIGCHACTVACKAENDVVLGSFRTWVKWIEHGTYPEVQRSAAVLRCNHCSDAPCMQICPTSALHKTANGIVDLDREACIGCASCLQACPYDALHIDERQGTAAKCHFCAHRLEVGFAPACVSVCPEQAIKVVDTSDPSVVRELESAGARVRKEERGTHPNTWYLDADPLALEPLAVDRARTLSHSEVPDPLPGPGTSEARAVYDVPRQRPWGGKISAYLVTKALAAGALLAACFSPSVEALDGRILGLLSLVFWAATNALLVADLHRPERFWYLLVRGNPRSWLVRGAWVLGAHAALTIPWILGATHPIWSWLGIPTALMTAVYSAFLFRQARGREMWSDDPLLLPVLGVQALAAAGALAWFWTSSPLARGAVALYAALVVVTAFWPMPTEHGRRAHHSMVRSPLFLGGVLAAFAAIAWPPAVVVAFVLLDHAYVVAGQEVPLS